MIFLNIDIIQLVGVFFRKLTQLAGDCLVLIRQQRACQEVNLNNIIIHHDESVPTAGKEQPPRNVFRYKLPRAWSSFRRQ